MEQTIREKVLIRLIKDIQKENLTTSDIRFIKDNIEQIWFDNYIKDRILQYVANNPYIR